MSQARRRFWSSVLSSLILLSMILSLIVPGLPQAAAQDTPDEPPPAQPEALEPEPVEPDPQVVVPTAEFFDNFNDGDVFGWILSGGWALAPQDGVLAASAPGETAVVGGKVWEDVNVSARMGLTPSDTANLSVRMGDSGYTLTLDSAGNLYLFRGAALVAQGTNSSPRAADGLTWYALTLNAVGGTITAAVDGQWLINYTDADPLPAGWVVFSTGVSNTGTTTLDDVAIRSITVPQVFTISPAQQELPVEPDDLPDPVIPAEVIVVPDASEGSVIVDAAEPEHIDPLMVAGGIPVISADFESLGDQWTLTEGAGVGPDGGNMVAGLLPGTSLYPSSRVVLNDHVIRARVNILTAADEGVADGLSLFFRSDEQAAYLLTFETTRTALYRKDGETYTLLETVEAQRALNTWYSIQVDVRGDQIRFWVDDAAVLTYTDDNPLAGGQFAVVANGSSVLVDDVAVYSEDILSTLAAPSIVPFAISEAARAKFGGAFLNMLQAHLSGDTAGAAAAASDYAMQTDSQNRFRLFVYPAAGEPVAAVAAQIQALGGVVTRLDAAYVEAYIALDDVLPIADLDSVAALTLPDMAVSTGNTQAEVFAGTGTVLPHSLDIIGANSWHIAGYTGASVNIAVIDTSFAEAGDGDERACLGSTVVELEGTAGTSSHGMQVVEVLCDVAPGASVWMYQATNASELVTMIERAAQLNNQRSVNNFPQAHVILITMDPGATTSFANAVNAAVAQNIPVIVSAGNTGSNAAFSFGFPGGESLLTINASAGSVISYRWDNANVYTTRLLAGDVVLDSRSANTGTSSSQYRVPNSCGESCVLTLQLSGEAPANFSVRIAGGNENINEIALDTNLIPFASGSLTELASLDSVISVGAVCSWQTGNGSNISRYQILPNSSTGAVGQENNANIKPSVVAPSLISTSIAQAEPECDVNFGFGGTSAAASHVAGMAALLLSNPFMQGIYQAPVGVPSAVKTYLQTRSIDLHVGATPDGFDNVYGAGLVQLGNPEFNLGLQQQIATPANNVGGTAYYVSTSRVPTSGSPDGSPTNPFVHPAQAIQRAVDDGVANVVLMPGEYVTSFRIPNPGVSGLRIVSYDAVDTADWFPSAIWVNDTFEGASGISLNTVQNVQIIGFQFTGSTPLYELVLPPGQTSQSFQIAKVTPLDVTNASAIVVQDNTFASFDKPIIVEGSEDVSFVNNVFSEFEIPVTQNLVNGVLTEVPLYTTVVFNIRDSGQTTPIRIERGDFINNVMPINLGTAQSAWMEPVVGIERSGVEIFNNKFLNNTGESMIAINQWNSGAEAPETPPDGSFVTSGVTVYGSWFDANNVNKSLIQLYLGETFRFVNNTVSNHVLSDSSFGSIIGLGHEASVFLNFTDHRYDIVNNVFYNNAVGARLIGHPNFGMGNNGCLPIGGSPGASPDPNVNRAARSNWFAPAFAFGDCAVSIGTTDGVSDNNNNPLNNNNFTNTWEGIPLIAPGSPSPEDLLASEQARAAFSAFYFFTADNDPVNPYRLRPTPDELLEPPPATIRRNPGVDTGETALTLAVPNAPITDLFGFPRVIDRPPDVGAEVDRGAYELGNPDPISFTSGGGNINRTVVEDTIVTISLKEKLQGGFEPYRFTFTRVPTVFDTNPLSACNGQPYSLNPQTYVLTYCPPPDFYNQGLTTTYPQANVIFEYEAFGLLDVVGAGTGKAEVEINITSVPETQPLNPTAPTKFLVVDSTTELRYRLEPWQIFDQNDNLQFSHPDPSIFQSSPDVDFPLTYTAVSVDTGATLFNPQIFDETFPENPSSLSAAQIVAINAALNNAISQGVFEINTPAGLLPVLGETGAFEFTYTVTDIDGQSGARRVRVRIADRPPGDSDPGDGGGGPGSPGDPGDPDGGGGGTSPGGGGGGPGGGGPGTEIIHIGMFDEASLNFVYSDGWMPYYYQAAINETIHFTTGANQSVTFSFDGDAFAIHWLGYPGGGGYTLEIDHNDDGVFTPYNDASLNLVCSGTSKPSTLSTSISSIQTFAFGCSGLDAAAPDALRTLRMTSTSAAPIILDAVEVRGLNLLPGFYSDDDYAVAYSSGWSPYDLIGAKGDTIHYANSPNQTMRFNVDGDLIDSLIIYYITGPGFDSFEVRYNGQLAQTVDTHSAGVYLGQATVVPGIGDGPIQVEIRTTGSGFVLVEGFELLGPRASLKPGYHALNNPRFRVAGTWLPVGANILPDSRTGEVYLNLQPDAGGVLFTVDATQATRLVVHYGNEFFWGSMQICGETCTSVMPLGSAPRPFTSTMLEDLGLSGDKASVAINVIDGWIGLEAIELLPAPGTLRPGYYDQYRDSPDIVFSGNWDHQLVAGPRDGTASWAFATSDTMQFGVPGDIDGIVVYHSFGAGIQVCANDGTETCFSIANPASGSKVYGGRTYVTRTDLGLDTADATITIRPGSATPVAIEGIHIVRSTSSGFSKLPNTRNSPNASELRYVGQWSSLPVNGPIENTLRYSVLPNTAMLFEIEGEGVTLHHTSGLGRGSFEICIDITTCQTISASGAAEELKWSVTTTVLSVGGQGRHLVEIRSLDNWFGVEAVDVVSSVNKLGFGRYDESNPNLRYTGAWTLLQDITADGGAVRTGSGSAQVSFTLDTTQGGRLVVNHLNDVRWGSMQVCVDADCQTINQSSAMGTTSATFTFGAGSPGVVTITAPSGTISFDGLAVLPGGATLQTGFYDEDSPYLTYTGTWSPYEHAVFKGGAIVYALGTATMSFNVNADAANAVAIHHPTGAGWGTMRVCGPGSACQDINLATQGPVTRFNIAAGDNPLNLTGPSAQVTVSHVSGFVALDGIELSSATRGIPPGLYEDGSINLALTSTEWASLPGPYSGGSLVYTFTPDATINFTIGGGVKDVDPPVTGFTLFLARFSVGGTFEVCYTRVSNGKQTCRTDTAANAAAELPYGFGYYGLAPLNTAGTANETYNVTLRYTGTASQALIFDALTVLGRPSTTLTLGTDGSRRAYDSADPAILYTPDSMWYIDSYPNIGLYKGTYSFTTTAGAAAQLRMRGNALTMYQIPYLGGSNEVQFCVVIGNDRNSAVQCNNYALNGTAYLGTSAITLYGFGFGTRDLIIENRSPYYGLLIDAVEVR